MKYINNKYRIKAFLTNYSSIPLYDDALLAGYGKFGKHCDHRANEVMKEQCKYKPATGPLLLAYTIYSAVTAVLTNPFTNLVIAPPSLARAPSNLVTASTNLVKGITSLVRAPSNLVRASANLVTASASLVKALANLVSAFASFVRAITSFVRGLANLVRALANLVRASTNLVRALTCLDFMFKNTVKPVF